MEEKLMLSGVIFKKGSGQSENSLNQTYFAALRSEFAMIWPTSILKRFYRRTGKEKLLRAWLPFRSQTAAYHAA